MVWKTSSQRSFVAYQKQISFSSFSERIAAGSWTISRRRTWGRDSFASGNSTAKSSTTGIETARKEAEIIPRDDNINDDEAVTKRKRRENLTLLPKRRWLILRKAFENGQKLSRFRKAVLVHVFVTRTKTSKQNAEALYKDQLIEQLQTIQVRLGSIAAGEAVS